MRQLTSKVNVSENPFYKMPATLRLFSELQKVDDATVTKSAINQYLTDAWKECKDERAKRELFMVIMFSIGDIQNREHNIFRKAGIKDVPNGGLSKRRTFAICLMWLCQAVPDQFYAALPAIADFYNLDGTMLYELRTDRFKGTVKEILHIPINVERVISYIVHVLTHGTTSENDKALWARWLPHIPSSKRTRKYVINEKNIKAFTKGGHKVEVGSVVSVSKDKQAATIEKDKWTTNFIYKLSQAMSWEVVKYKGNIDFKGYKKFKSQYLEKSEAHLFSSGKICEMDKFQFHEWLEQLPGSARFRVQCRLVQKDDKVLKPKNKWVSKHGFNFGEAYLEWIKAKEVAQERVRNLSVEDKAKLAPKELKQLEKDAKINTGGDTLIDIVAKLLTGRDDLRNTDLIAHTLLEKIKIDVPVLVITDVSGSMNSVSVLHKGVRFTAKSMAQLLTTIFLLKNPDPELQSMFMRFDDKAEMITAGQQVYASSVNRFMSTSSTTIPWLVDRTKKFSENLVNVSQYVIARDGTNIGSIATGFKKWVDSEPVYKQQRIEQINKYPVFLIVSDGDFNNARDAVSSLRDFQSSMRQWFGWEGVVVIWDVKEEQKNNGPNKFENVDNVMYFGGCNPGVLNQIFLNIHDLDIVDVYLPLKAMHESVRYSPVRAVTI